MRPAQRIHEQKFPKAPPLLALIDGETPEQGCRNERIMRKLARRAFWQRAEIDGEGRESVIAEYSGVARLGDSDERRGNVPARVLTGLLPDIAVERFIAA